MNSSQRQVLERKDATYMHDYVVGGPDGSVEGVVIGLNNQYDEALIHEYNEGSPTMTIHAVDRYTIEHHEQGRSG